MRGYTDDYFGNSGRYCFSTQDYNESKGEYKSYTNYDTDSTSTIQNIRAEDNKADTQDAYYNKKMDDMRRFKDKINLALAEISDDDINKGLIMYVAGVCIDVLHHSDDIDVKIIRNHQVLNAVYPELKNSDRIYNKMCFSQYRKNSVEYSDKMKIAFNTVWADFNDELFYDSVYINVPFQKKDLAKKLGAKWDTAVKKWYAPDNTYSELLRQFPVSNH